METEENGSTRTVLWLRMSNSKMSVNRYLEGNKSSTDSTTLVQNLTLKVHMSACTGRVGPEAMTSAKQVNLSASDPGGPRGERG